jgi:hypothetical protein
MKAIMTAVLKAGLLTPEMLKEFKRFSPVVDREAETGEPMGLEDAAALIEAAIQSEQYVLLRETDLEIVRQYADTARRSVLHVEHDGEVSDIEVSYGRTPIGEFIIPWRSESIRDMLTNGQTYLVVAATEVRAWLPDPYQAEGQVRIFFKDVREVFFGEQKAFMVCSASTVDHGGK